MTSISVVTAGTNKIGAYRVVPDPDDPVIFQLQENLIKVFDISAAGITTNSELVEPGRRYRYLLDLPTRSTPVDGMLDTSSRNEKGRIFCKFFDLTPKESDALHHYVLQRQKQAIRLLKRGFPE